MASTFLWGITIAVALTAAGDAPFETFLRDVADDAVATGVPRAVVETAFADLEPDPRVIRFDRNQPEVTQTLATYLSRRVTDAVVEEGRGHARALAPTLDALERRYGVDASVLVAIWGIESRYGRHVGTYDVVRSLATLAHDPRRSAFFRGQLIAALRLAHQEGVPARVLAGSWAGAMGQPQFMPSTFLEFAADGDGDGRRDIWETVPDVLASVANLLSHAGWRPREGWGRRLAAPVAFAVRPAVEDQGCRALRRHSRPATAAQWAAVGVDVGIGTAGDAAFTLWQADGDVHAASDNFRALLSYNCANSYALAVSMLADRVATADSVR